MYEVSMASLLTLDLFAAFDVTDHSKLTRCVEFTFGLEHDALSWMKCCLTDRAGSKSANFPRWIVCVLTHFERSTNNTVSYITLMQMILNLKPGDNIFVHMLLVNHLKLYSKLLCFEHLTMVMYFYMVFPWHVLIVCREPITVLHDLWQD